MAVAPHASLLRAWKNDFIHFEQPLAFEAGQVTLKKSSTNAAALDALASVLRAARRPAVIGCHSDNMGNDEYNQRLTLGRAESVRDALAQRSVANVSAEGYGKTRPIASNANEKGRAQNRRCEVVLR